VNIFDGFLAFLAFYTNVDHFEQYNNLSIFNQPLMEFAVILTLSVIFGLFGLLAFLAFLAFWPFGLFGLFGLFDLIIHFWPFRPLFQKLSYKNRPTQAIFGRL
jgi:hypothetical protein